MIIWLIFSMKIFYRQSIRLDGKYVSDMYSHMLYAMGDNVDYVSTYPIYFLTIKVIYHLFFFKQFLGPELSIALATLFYSSISVVAFKVVYDVYITKHNNAQEKLSVRRISSFVINNLFIFSVFLVNMIFDIGTEDVFFETMGPNPWHNGTYLAARPFAIISFFLFCDLVDKYERSIADRKEYICFSIVFVLMTLAKPSYTLVLGASAAVVLLYRFIKGKFSTFSQTLKLSLTFVPPLIVLIIQYVLMCAWEDGSGAGRLTLTAFGKVWAHYSDNIPLSIVKGGLFPLLILVIYRKKAFKDTYMRISIVSYIIGLMSYLSFSEAGRREFDADFAWGYMYSLMISYMASLIFLVLETRHCNKSEKKEVLKLIPSWAGYMVNLVYGILYFIVLLNGGR